MNRHHDRIHIQYAFGKAVKGANSEAIASCLGHALRTGSLKHMRILLVQEPTEFLKD